LSEPPRLQHQFWTGNQDALVLVFTVRCKLFDNQGIQLLQEPFFQQRLDIPEIGEVALWMRKNQRATLRSKTAPQGPKSRGVPLLAACKAKWQAPHAYDGPARRWRDEVHSKAVAPATSAILFSNNRFTEGRVRKGRSGGHFEKELTLKVLVRDNNVDQALRVLKKKLQRDGLFREIKRRKAYEKPSERKSREKTEAIRRGRKAARKLAQREGLLPSPRIKRPTFGR
jgi:small subunit ribosomal protein S21